MHSIFAQDLPPMPVSCYFVTEYEKSPRRPPSSRVCKCFQDAPSCFAFAQDLRCRFGKITWSGDFWMVPFRFADVGHHHMLSMICALCRQPTSTSQKKQVKSIQFLARLRGYKRKMMLCWTHCTSIALIDRRVYFWHGQFPLNLGIGLYCLLIPSDTQIFYSYYSFYYYFIVV